MSLKVAIVGCGKIADGHIEEIQKLSNLAEVVAVCDLEPLMAEQIAVRYGLSATYSDFDQLLERERPDVVHIATPPGAHLPLATRAIEAGAHVFVEKPLAPELEQCRAMIDAAEAANRKLTVGWTSFFAPPAVAMRELIAEGAIGDVVHVESYYGYDLSGAFGKALLSSGDHWVHRLPGKLLHNTVDHMFNKMVEFIDDDSPRVLATGLRRREQRFGDLRDDMHDELRLILRGGGVTGYGTFSSHISPASEYCRIYGTKDSLDVDFVSRAVTFATRAKLPSAIGRLVPAFEQAYRFASEGGRNLVRFAKSDFHFFAGLQELFRLFYRSILDDSPPPIAYRDILRVCYMHDQTWAQLAAEDAEGVTS
jgi:predicted dehydrogenase